MHLEFLVEDSSGGVLLEALVPRILGPQADPHTWRIFSYKGVGRLPADLGKSGDPAKRILLDQLPRLLRGYGRTPGVDAVVVVLDSDRRPCRELLAELQDLLAGIQPAPPTLFRLAIEEMEAWYLGDRKALTEAYPRANQSVLQGYSQDAVCGTWELLADALHPGGSKAIRKAGWPLPGEVKHEWARRIGPKLDPDRNTSPSFQKFCSGLRRITGRAG